MVSIRRAANMASRPARLVFFMSKRARARGCSAAASLQGVFQSTEIGACQKHYRLSHNRGNGSRREPCRAHARRALAEIDNHDVMRAYRRWAPVYDATFGKVVEAGVKQATSIINKYHGRVLEVGVGTGLSLPHYKHSLKVTGIDLSPDMLMRARERVQQAQSAPCRGAPRDGCDGARFPRQQFRRRHRDVRDDGGARSGRR